MLATGLKDYAVSEGVGVFGTDLFIRIMPDRPDNAICIFDEPGQPTAEMNSYDADSFGSQWLIRGSYTFAKEKVLEIHRKIVGLSGIYDGIHILDTHIQTEPAFVENDEKGRAVYSMHYTHDCSIGQNKHRTAI